MKKIILIWILLLLPLISAGTQTQVNYSTSISNTSLFINATINVSQIIAENNSINVTNYYTAFPITTINNDSIYLPKSNSYVNFTLTLNNTWYEIGTQTSSSLYVNGSSLTNEQMKITEFSLLTTNLVGSVSKLKNIFVQILYPSGDRRNWTMSYVSGQQYSFNFIKNHFVAEIYGTYNFEYIFINDTGGLINKTLFNETVVVVADTGGSESQSIGGSVIQIITSSAKNLTNTTNTTIEILVNPEIKGFYNRTILKIRQLTDFLSFDDKSSSISSLELTEEPKKIGFFKKIWFWVKDLLMIQGND